MPSILDTLDVAFRNAIRAAYDIDADPLIAASATAQFGDYQSNIAMGLAKRVADQSGQKTSPRQVAEQIKAKLDLGEMASEIGIAGPGFLNVRLSPAWLVGRLNALADDPKLGVPVATPAETVVVDYSAPNVAKEMHVGHLRSTIIGDCFARTLAFLGHDVIRQNHIGDWGTQFGMLIEQLESTGGDVHARLGDLEGFYRQAKQRFDADAAFADASRQRVVRLQAGDEETLAQWRTIVDATRQYNATLYARMRVQLTDAAAQSEPIERGESFYNAMLPAIAGDLAAKPDVAQRSDGALVAFAAGYPAPLIVQKSDGGFGYATTDLAAIRYRVGTLHAGRIIYVVGSPQAQHFAQVFDVARRAGWAGAAVLEHAGFGSVLGPDGKLFRTRTGGTVKLVDLLDEAEARAFTLVSEKSGEMPEPQRREIARAVGVGAVKYFDLLRDRVGDYKFSFDAMLAMDGNTAPYLQYAYARIRSIFRKAASATGDASAGHAIAALAESQELTLAKTLMRFAPTVESVGRELKPHLLCTYLYDLAGAFSSFYDNCPVLKSEEPTRASRLALCDLSARTIACGLDLLGIEHPEQM